MKRRALLCLAVPAVVAARGARAFREQTASADVARAWADRCAGTAAPHAGPVTICPFCGCPVAAGREHGEAGPLPPG